MEKINQTNDQITIIINFKVSECVQKINGVRERKAKIPPIEVKHQAPNKREKKRRVFSDERADRSAVINCCRKYKRT
jgi:hypothetical protein